MDNAFVKPAQEVLAYFGADTKVGLTEEQVKKAREKYGFNGEAIDDVVIEHCVPEIATIGAHLAII